MRATERQRSAGGVCARSGPLGTGRQLADYEARPDGVDAECALCVRLGPDLEPSYSFVAANTWQRTGVRTGTLALCGSRRSIHPCCASIGVGMAESAWPRRRAHIRACSYICPAWHAAGVFVSARHRFPVQIWLGRAHAIGVCVCVARHRDDAAFRCIRRLGYHLQGVAETLPALHTQMNSTGSMHATAITGDGRWDSGVQRMR